MSSVSPNRRSLSLKDRFAQEKSRRRRTSAVRRAGFEPLENRLLLARVFAEVEANNTLVTANIVQHFNPTETGVVDSRSNGATITNGDVDYYTFTAAVTGEIVVTLTNQGGNPSGDAATDDDLTLQQRSAGDVLVGSTLSAPTPTRSVSKTVSVMAGDQLWFRVAGATGADDANYQLVIQNRDRADHIGGNNDTQATATPLGTLGSIPAANLQGYTITSPDRDYFSFVVPAAATPVDLSISANMPTGSGAASGSNGPTNLGVRVRNLAGTVVSSSNGTTTATDTAVLSVPGSASATTYFVEVYSGSLGQVNRYDLSIGANVVPTGSISGWKFNDLNADGMWDENEPGIGGVQINLDLNNDSVIDTSVNTAGDGYYSFANVPLGTHLVTETTPANSIQSLPGAPGNFGYFVALTSPNDLILDHLDFGNYQLDFGDAPDPTYPTLLARSGARHVINPTAGGLRLGATIDAEADGQPNGTATGDGADEDGITQTNVWTRGNSATFNVASSGYGYLNAWVDFNHDGDWLDAGEQVTTDALVAPGPNPLSFAVPVGAVLGATNARFRLSPTTGTGLFGQVIDGEVEDYQFNVFAPATIQFQSSTLSVAETAGSQAINLVLSIPGGGTLSNNVTIDVSDLTTGTAIGGGTDYTFTPNPRTVTFPAGSIDGTVISTASMNITNDLIAELDETVNFDLVNLTGSGGQVTIGTPNDLTVTITDDADRAAVSFRFATGASNVAEANVNHPVNVELVTTGGITLGVAISVNVDDVGGGTATPGGVDYTYSPNPKIALFPAASGNGALQPVTVAIVNDTIAEPDETLNLGLSTLPSPFGTYTIGGPTAHTVTITDASDRGNVSVRFVTNSSSVAEANVTHNVGVQLSMTGGITSIGGALTVDVSDTGGGTATSGADYGTYSTQTLTFPSGSINGATQNATPGILDDLLAEPDETFNLGLSNVNGPGSLGAPSAHQVTITDAGDRGLVSVHFQSASSSVGEANTTHNVVAELVAGGGITLAAPVTVNVTNLGTGTASGGGVDYTFAPNPTVVTFAAASGNGATQNVPVTIVDDAIFEFPDETINFGMSFVSGPASGISASTTHQVTIVDNDGPTVSIVSANDGNEAGPVNGQFTISISVLSASPITVNYSVGGTATPGAGQDYTALSGSIVIPANTASVPLNVLVNNDNRVEGTETVTVNLTGVPMGVVIDGIANNAQVNILDNDSATVNFTSAAYSTGEASSPANLVVGLSLSTNGAGPVEIQYPISVDVTDLVTGSATGGGVDYTFTPNPTTVTFPAGFGSGITNVPVTIVSDGIPEPNETVDFSLGNLTGPASLGAITNTTLTITNDDFAAVTGRKFHDLNGNGVNDAEPGLAGWTIQLYADANSNGIFEPNIYVGGVLLDTGADGDPIATTVTNAAGDYILGNSALPTQRLFVNEVQQQGWTQTSSPTAYTVNHVLNATDTGRDFGNATCTDTLNVVNGTQSFVAPNTGVLTVELIGGGGGTFTVDRGGASFTAYNGAGGTTTTTIATSRSSEYAPRETGRQRVDILVTAGQLINVNVSGATPGATLRIVDSVNVAFGTTLALQITGTVCGETIFVADDQNFGATSDAKRIFIGATSGNYDANVDLGFTGVEYNAALINAMFGNPTISRIDINALGGDDVVRIADATVSVGANLTQQSSIQGGDGNDVLRAGSGKSTITAGAGYDFVVGGISDDTIYGGTENDYLFGGNGADSIFGDDGNDWIGGGDGDDPLLRGGNGLDSISGGTGRDRLNGEAGADIAYRDAIDLQVLDFSTVNVVPPSQVGDAVAGRLNDLIDQIWEDHHQVDGNDDASLDTLDELLRSLLP